VSENWAKSICNVCVRLHGICIGERKARSRKQEAKETATHTSAAAAAVSLHVYVHMFVAERHTQTADDAGRGRVGGSSVNLVAMRNKIRAFGF